MFSWINRIFITAGCGLFVLTGAHQAYGSVNWAGQYCGLLEGCTHSKWIVLGSALAICACVMCTQRDAESI
jgi:hypothetical protein